MKILFITTHAYLPQRSGGSESSTRDLCLAMKKRGHKVAVMSSLAALNWLWVVNRLTARFTGKLMPKDTKNGYPVYRGWHILEGLQEVITHFKPDCVITQAGETIPLIHKLNELNIKTFVYLRDVSFATHGGEYFTSSNVNYIANSEFTANQFKALTNIPACVIPPLVDKERFLVSQPLERKYVLFVCPYPEKGLNIALSLAGQNLDIPFIFLESWPLNEVDLKALELTLQSLPNVTLVRTQQSMLPIYQQTKISLIPSVCEEAWGRIATESHINGIPVLASDIGGLPESVGNGGMLIPTDADIEQWSNALRKLWDDNEFYQKISNQARLYSNRKEINVDYLAQKLKVYLTDS